MHIFGCWTGDGESILFAANRRHPGLFDVYRQRLDGEAELVWAERAGRAFCLIFLFLLKAIGWLWP